MPSVRYEPVLSEVKFGYQQDFNPFADICPANPEPQFRCRVTRSGAFQDSGLQAKRGFRRSRPVSIRCRKGNRISSSFLKISLMPLSQ
jgi:hypothetical protein